MKNKKNQGPKVLIIDIETSYLEVRSWGIRDVFINDDDIIKDWSIMSYAAKWLDDLPNKVMYMDTSKKKDKRDDKELVLSLHSLLQTCDVVLSQNGKKFDTKKINTRFLYYGLDPIKHYRHIDILVTNKKHFSHTSNKLSYITKKLNKKYKKLTHKQFPGTSLWTECLNGNPKAWKEMKEYNIYDILSLEESYKVLAPWDDQVNFALYQDDGMVCSCGNRTFKKKGYRYTGTGKFQTYRCKNCGKEYRSGQNLLSKEQKANLLK